MVEHKSEGVSLQALLVRLVAAKARTHAVVFHTVNRDGALQHSHAVDAHGVERIHPVFGGQGEAYFADGFFVKKRSCGLAALRRDD